MSKQLFILISTLNDRILNIENILQKNSKTIRYVVSHQVTEVLNDEVNQFIELLRNREDVYYSELKGMGVAKNRNNTLHFIEPGSISLILDDDVQLCNNIFRTVMKSFDDNPTAEFISFKILDMNGNDYKPYLKEKQWHTLRTLTGVGTTEMAFKSDLILKNNILFDERFGPGSEVYPTGEDFIFAMDIYKLKANMLFIPIPIVKHPDGSTGRQLDNAIIFGRGAVFARVFGFLSFVLDIYFSYKKRKSYQFKYSFYHYVKLMLLGSYDYLFYQMVSCSVNKKTYQDKDEAKY